MNKQAMRELLAVVRELARECDFRPRVATGVVSDFLKVRPGGRITLVARNNQGGRSVYAHIWFDNDVARDDFGNRVSDSGEWEVIVSDSADFIGGRQFARESFRYADPKMRNDVARIAADWTTKQLNRAARE